ncbi:MAG TPA: hypothetical protein VHZ07_08225 [Bryobacteraceae bacterium]|jgi:2-keto-4-pentenoate hydratase|nr:hypothetical protein [Bryobacteraceae bacterium]
MAAHRLLIARKAKTPSAQLPEECRPTNLEEAIEIQSRVSLLLDEPVEGWKCSVPGPPVVAAPIYASLIHSGPICPVLTADGLARVEPEIAFVLARDVNPQDRVYTAAEIAESIGETRLVLEIIGGRYAEPDATSFPELLADNLSNQGVFVGPRVDINPQLIPGDFPILVKDGQHTLIERHGRHPNGHPIRSFQALIRSLAQRGEAMKKGLLLITGSFAGVLEVPVERVLDFTFGQLGVLTAQFSRDTESGAEPEHR